jgi:UDP-N-acetylmuramoylalanine--D-glutamate ligase
MSISAFALQTNFNVKNAMASSTLIDLMQVRIETIRESFSDFENEEHRLEKVLRINGVQYINDSKAVNVNATFYSLETMDNPTVWIVGGIDKGNDYESLLPLVNEKVKAIICLGFDNHKVIETFSNVVDFMIETSSIEEAVKIAYKLSVEGDAVLLSPACSSYDMFENLEDRGKQFKYAVRQL